MNIIQTINDIGSKLQLGTTKRIDCPFCGRKNTFSVTKETSQILWNCFSTHCKISGRRKNLLTSEDICSKLKPKKQEEMVLAEWVPPQWFVGPFERLGVEEYLIHHNALKPVLYNQCQLAYDPVAARLVFLVKRGNKIYNGVGRKLSLHTLGPKWLNYHAQYSNIPFIVENGGDVLVIVEDCISACTMSRKPLTGMALLGTSITDVMLANTDLKAFRKAVIMLDRDANARALELHKKLSPFIRCMTYLSETDPKNMSIVKIDEAYERLSI